MCGTMTYAIEIYIPERLDPIGRFTMAEHELAEQIAAWDRLGYQYKVV